MGKIEFTDDNGSFVLENAENYSYLYFPIAGDNGLKSSITPNLGGDSKINQNTFLLEPESSENLHNNRSTRNFWCRIDDKYAWSATGVSAEQEYRKFTEGQDSNKLEAGFMWHKVSRKSDIYKVSSVITSFVSVEHNTEVTYVTITNNDDKAHKVTPVAAIPVYGRSADNLRDHRHVTSLLHRISTFQNGIKVKPVLSFDERGHQKNDMTYYVCGMTGEGKAPVGFYPVVSDFIGEGGTFLQPEAVREGKEPVGSGAYIQGKEALGGIVFEDVVLEAGESRSFTVLCGVSDRENEIDEVINLYADSEKVEKSYEAVKAYWTEKVNVSFQTGSEDFDMFMKWVCFQPILRRIYGCSFLPYHDYGKGGRGWRDLWQDCLALLLMNPSGVRKMIMDNYGGVRFDGTNATIIGEKPGEFVADRNNITRVWMDHGFWPFLTTKLYIDQTGDIELLAEKTTYFKDKQVERGTATDEMWSEGYGVTQKCESGDVYNGTVLEHLLIQNLCAFYDVGEHNHMRLRGADWNDALDMADERGESVAFTAAYSGNFADIAEYIRMYSEKTGETTVELAKEIKVLISGDAALYDDIDAKKKVLSDYGVSCRHNVSGEKENISVDMLCEKLVEMSQWIQKYISETEWIDDEDGNGWFNGYYDNSGEAVEGTKWDKVRMMLTGQVFTIMSGTADDEKVKRICKSADKYLFDAKAGGYRLNTDFGEEKFDLGRMFGFAYGEKENGAVFSHMTVMYATALYQRGFVKEGHKALQALADSAMDFDTSKMYPGIPEYFDIDGRGMYTYLTGAASWYMLAMITEVFGVKGQTGNLVLEPKLVLEQFDAEDKAKLEMIFAGHTFEIQYENENRLEYGEYEVGKAVVDNVYLEIVDGKAVLKRDIIDKLQGQNHKITATLIKK